MLLSLVLPALVWAAPANPAGFCDRFIKESDQAACEKEAASRDLDWYAAGLCGLVEADENLLPCWKAIDGRAFYPPRLAECEKPEMDDGDRQACLVRVSSAGESKKGRVPANERATRFQELSPKKKNSANKKG